MLVLTLICYRESYAPVLLERKAARLRKKTGEQRHRSKFDRGGTPAHVFWMALKRPLKLLFLSPIVFLMALFAAVTYGYLYLMFTTISAIFITNYGWSQGESGLAYIGFGVGAIIGLLFSGRVANHIARSHSARGCFTPESRLLPMLMGCWALPAGLFWYGWTAQARTHWIVPILGTGVFGFGLMAVFVSARLVVRSRFVDAC
jgi:predicted MFS family arabinose efflux permease